MSDTRPSSTAPTRTITLGGGCFWCTEAVFVRVRGVLDVESGYCNGHTAHPTYAQVCDGNTGHAEVVRLTYDPQVIGLPDLLNIFFSTHDPTTLNRQGNDVGTQYRSGIYYDDAADRPVAEAVRDAVNQSLGGQVVTEILALHNYHPAEDYHQDYFEQHPGQGYCAFVVAPKVHKFETHFKDWLRDA
jgi:peptide-methionine (S)-S-oxide reductase